MSSTAQIQRFLTMLGAAGLLAMGVVQQRVALVTVGYEVEELRRLKDDFLDQNRVLQYNVLILQSPMVLDRRLARSHVQLAPPEGIELLTHPARLLPTRPVKPVAVQPTGLGRTQGLALRWLGEGRQAEAKQ